MIICREEEMNVSENGGEGDNSDDESFIRRYNLDNYDNDDETENTALSLANITVHASNDEDPYLEQGSDVINIVIYLSNC